MKAKELKKTLAMLLTAAMCVSLGACGGNDDGRQEPGGTESETAGESTETRNYWEMLDEVSDTSELPDWTGEILEVNVWIAGGTVANIGSISDTNVTFKELERVTGVRFNAEESIDNNGDNIDARMPQLIASDNLPTMVVGWDIDTQLRELYDNGYLADLTEYYENGDLDQMFYWMPLEEYDQIMYSGARTEENEYYLIPTMLGVAEAAGVARSYATNGYSPEEYDQEYDNLYSGNLLTATGIDSSSMLYVRDDILAALYPDALTMEEVEDIYVEEGKFTEEQIFDVELNSAEDFFNFLYDVKELLASREFTGLNGRAVEVTYGPHTGTDNWSWMNLLPRLVNGFQTNTDYFCTALRNPGEDSDLLQRSIDMEEFIGWMKSLNTLINDDVIAQNSLVDNAAAFEEKINNGQYAVIYGLLPTRGYNIDGSEGGWSYRPLWVNTPVNEDFGGFGSLTKSYCGIFKDSLTDAQLDQLVHCINYLMSSVGTNNFYWGPATAGLFTEDVDGNRIYKDKDVEACMIYGEINDTGYTYGLWHPNNGTSENKTYDHVPMGVGRQLLQPSYLAASQMERTPSDAALYYTPGTLPGLTYAENTIEVVKTCQVYGLGAQIEELQQFWSAREGFENQMKKVIAATPENFEKELDNLIQYADENGLTKEAIEKFNDLFIETNRAELEAVGIID